MWLEKTLKSLDLFIKLSFSFSTFLPLVQEIAFASFANNILFILFWNTVYKKFYSNILYCNFKLAVTFEYLSSAEFSFFRY